jgi:hypothetical protein
VRYPSERCPVKYILMRKGNTKEIRYTFSEKDRREEIRDGNDRSIGQEEVE